MKKLALVFSLIVFSSAASANFQQDLLKSKKAKPASGKDGGSGENTQWTLADWIAQKNKVRLMDQWLAAHSHTPIYDLDVRASTQSFTYRIATTSSTTTTTQNSMNYQADVNLWILNFNGEYQKTNDSKESNGGAAGLRLLGESSQSTSLVARYGWRKLNDLPAHEVWENQYVEGLLQIYVIQQFGMEGKFRYYLSGTSNLGNTLDGHLASAGVFLESSFLRVFADYFQEPLSFTNASSVTRKDSDGFSAGAKFFF